MTARRLPGLGRIIDERSGAACPGAQVRVERDGIPVTTFSGPDLAHAHASPICADKDGALPPIYVLGDDPVDIEIRTASGVVASRYSGQ